MKAEHKNLGGLLEEIHVPTCKLEDINMVFMVDLPRIQKQYDSLWVIVNSLIKSAHFIPVKSTYSAKHYSKIYTDDIVCRYGILLSIISDRCSQITSRFGRFILRRVG